MLALCSSPLAVLKDFDIDCCCVAFIPSDAKVVTTKRGLRTLIFGANVCDSSFDNWGYCRRLDKYAARGFGVAVPGFEPHRLGMRIFDASYIIDEKHDLLLKVAQKVGVQDVIKNFERLVVMAYARNRIRPHAHSRALLTGDYHLLRGDAGYEEDCKNYLRTPCTLMSVLLEQWSLGGDEEGEWLRGGATPRCPVKRVKDLLCNSMKLCCVYDFCTCDTPLAGWSFYWMRAVLRTLMLFFCVRTGWGARWNSLKRANGCGCLLIGG